MARFNIGGSPFSTTGELPEIGRKAPDFILTKTDLSDVSPKDFDGKRVVFNIFPSIDTSVCSASVRKFNADLAKYDNTVVLCVSKDLPFAHARFCEAEGLKDVIPVSELRNQMFGDNYGMRIADGPMAGLFARSVVVLDETGTVIYTQLAEDVKNEPNYQGVMDILTKAGKNMDVCTTSETAEHTRADSMDEPCDDGRSG